MLYRLCDGQVPSSLYGDRASGSRTDLQEEEEEEEGQDAIAEDGGSEPESDTGSCRDTDLDSEEDDYDEPTVSSGVDAKYAEILALKMRPEKVDSLDLPEYKRGDRRKYDFEVSTSEIPVYAFPGPLSDDLQELDLRDLSGKNKDWREVMTSDDPVDPEEEYILDKLSGYAKLEQKTIEAERIRAAKVKAVRERQQRSRIYGMARVQSAKTWRERRCCGSCMQPACVGDCPTKPLAVGSGCSVCGERDCSGDCSVAVYDSRTRTPADDSSDTPTAPPSRPRSCTTCRARHAAKYINANQLLQGRPRSSHATYSRGQQFQGKPETRFDRRNDIEPELVQEIQTWDINPREASDVREQSNDIITHREDAPTRRRGRAAAIPGKSWFSQRRYSLTDKGRYRRVKSASGRRAKQTKPGRVKRPQTANI